MKKLDMTDYVETEVEVPELGEIGKNNVAYRELKPMTEEEIKAMYDELYGPTGELRDLVHLRGIR